MSLLQRLFGATAPATPKLSLVVVVYRMPRQAINTLYTLSPAYQLDAAEQDYEVIVVENSSSAPMGEAPATQFASNVKYFYREETQPTPVPAALFGAEQARGNIIGMMIDGARMASPGLVRNVLGASLSSANAVVAVPGYHLGHKLQQEAVNHGYDEAEEIRLLESVAWQENGYRLFDIACVSGSCKGGFFRPNAESNCLCMPRHIWQAVEGIEPRFTATGGGQANPDLYKRVCEHPLTDLVITPGEGTFHQFHGGVTTGTRGDVRAQHMQDHFEQYKALRGRYYKPPTTQARLYGKVSAHAMPFMRRSVEIAHHHPIVDDAHGGQK